MEEVWIDLLCDPQTSGGLLFSVPEEEGEEFLRSLEQAGLETEVSVIGRVLEKQDVFVRLV